MINIKIDGISEEAVKFGKKVTIESGKLKYVFYDKVKSGGTSKAYGQYKGADWGVGDSVNCEVSETNKPFKGKDGNMVDWTERKIIYFQDGEQGAGTAKNGQNPHQEAPKAESRVNIRPTTSLPIEADNRFKTMEAEVTGLRTRIEGVEKELNDRKNENNPF